MLSHIAWTPSQGHICPRFSLDVKGKQRVAKPSCIANSSLNKPSKDPHLAIQEGSAVLVLEKVGSSRKCTVYPRPNVRLQVESVQALREPGICKMATKDPHPSIGSYSSCVTEHWAWLVSEIWVVVPGPSNFYPAEFKVTRFSDASGVQTVDIVWQQHIGRLEHNAAKNPHLAILLHCSVMIGLEGNALPIGCSIEEFFSLDIVDKHGIQRISPPR